MYFLFLVALPALASGQTYSTVGAGTCEAAGCSSITVEADCHDAHAVMDLPWQKGLGGGYFQVGQSQRENIAGGCIVKVLFTLAQAAFGKFGRLDMSVLRQVGRPPAQVQPEHDDNCRVRRRCRRGQDVAVHLPRGLRGRDGTADDGAGSRGECTPDDHAGRRPPGRRRGRGRLRWHNSGCDPPAATARLALTQCHAGFCRQPGWPGSGPGIGGGQPGGCEPAGAASAAGGVTAPSLRRVLAFCAVLSGAGLRSVLYMAQIRREKNVISWLLCTRQAARPRLGCPPASS